MRDKYFLDTNIFVYSFSSEDKDKRLKSHDLITNALANRYGCISYQVIQEFINVATRKFVTALTIADCRKYLSSVLVPLCEIYSGEWLYFQALEISERWKYSFYDSLIITAAISAECSVIYTEDLQHGQKIQDLEIINPFL